MPFFLNWWWLTFLGHPVQIEYALSLARCVTKFGTNSPLGSGAHGQFCAKFHSWVAEGEWKSRGEGRCQKCQCWMGESQKMADFFVRLKQQMIYSVVCNWAARGRSIQWLVPHCSTKRQPLPRKLIFFVPLPTRRLCPETKSSGRIVVPYELYELYDWGKVLEVDGTSWWVWLNETTMTWVLFSCVCRGGGQKILAKLQRNDVGLYIVAKNWCHQLRNLKARKSMNPKDIQGQGRIVSLALIHRVSTWRCCRRQTPEVGVSWRDVITRSGGSVRYVDIVTWCWFRVFPTPDEGITCDDATKSVGVVSAETSENEAVSTPEHSSSCSVATICAITLQNVKLYMHMISNQLASN